MWASMVFQYFSTILRVIKRHEIEPMASLKKTLGRIHVHVLNLNSNMISSYIRAVIKVYPC